MGEPRPAIMAHLVASFPSAEASFEVGRGLVDAGAGYLEVQFPFSDPTADGIHIQRACVAALETGFTVRSGFRLVERLAALPQAPPIFVMVYANIAFRPGIDTFVERCRAAGANGVICPDLPPDYDEGLYQAGRDAGIDVIPVVPVTAYRDRLETVVRTSRSRYLYIALRKGVTGGYTEISQESEEFLRAAGALGLKVMAGFGISEAAQVARLARLVDVVIVGSAFIRALVEAPPGAQAYGTVRDLMARLVRP